MVGEGFQPRLRGLREAAHHHYVISPLRRTTLNSKHTSDRCTEPESVTPTQRRAGGPGVRVNEGKRSRAALQQIRYCYLVSPQIPSLPGCPKVPIGMNLPFTLGSTTKNHAPMGGLTPFSLALWSLVRRECVCLFMPPRASSTVPDTRNVLKKRVQRQLIQTSKV